MTFLNLILKKLCLHTVLAVHTYSLNFLQPKIEVCIKYAEIYERVSIKGIYSDS